MSTACGGDEKDETGDDPHPHEVLLFWRTEASSSRRRRASVPTPIVARRTTADALATLIRANNLRLRLSRSPIAARYSWGLRSARDVERWSDGIRLIDEWHLFDRPEPRISGPGGCATSSLLANIMGIYHYRLGDEGA